MTIVKKYIICHLLFQPQDVVASRLQMFDKMNVYHSKVKLSNWFNFVLGVETVQDILDKIELEKIRRELEGIARERARDLEKLGEGVNKLRGELMTARNYGLIDDGHEIPAAEDKSALLTLAQTAESANHKAQPAKSEYAIKKEIKKLEAEYAKACSEQTRAEKRVDTLKELTEAITKSGEANAEKRDRLQISKWISENWRPSKVCPVCGGDTHPAAHSEFDKICHVVEEIEKVKTSVAEFPATTLDELETRMDEADKAKRRAEDIFEQLDAVTGRLPNGMNS